MFRSELKYPKQSHCFPELYKKGSKGEIRRWFLKVSEQLNGTCVIITNHGVKGGIQQTAVQKIEAGKNIGKANETSTWAQAFSEAKAMWQKKKDTGYAEEGEINEVLLPMLALRLLDKPNTLYPVYVQPKLNGVRCLANKISESEIEYTSKTGKPYNTLEHLTPTLLRIMNVGEIFDGEIFSQNLTLQKIVSRVKREKSSREAFEGEDNLQYWVYDVCDTSSNYIVRYERLVNATEHAQKLFEEAINTTAAASNFNTQNSVIRLIDNLEAHSFGEVKKLHDSFVADGFEGCMVRIKNGPYRFKYRSPNLLKYKEFIDEEFEIVGGKSGTGKDEGTVIFRCKNKDGKEFDVRPKGTHAERTYWFNNLESCCGKQLTTRYQELTDEGIPRFAVGIVIRDYE